MLLEQFKSPEGLENIIKAIDDINIEPVKLMEICGTHTVSIARNGIKSVLPKNVKLVSGPGCPVCVTPMERINSILKIAEDKNIIIATYGDMIKVPGSVPGKTLENLKARGANVEIVYSAMDAVEIAKERKDKDVIFLGIGFETTAPATAVALIEAKKQHIDNFYVFSLHKMVEPVMRYLIGMDDFDINGFLCPGHVAVITGENSFKFLTDEYKIPAVICGFESSDILLSIYKLLLQIKDGRPHIENEYLRAVSEEGNTAAQKFISECFVPGDDIWRGMGVIKNSGMVINDEYEKHDAVKRFDIKLEKCSININCSCGEIIKGKMEPTGCKLFGKVCTPDNPFGPCMVSNEGVCAACYKYEDRG